jgi:sugar/nucleoside kinase (ribokinase family)
MTTLLIVGGMTIDRFPHGTSAPGGSVIHAGRAAVAEGASLTVLTIAGDEPEAAVGLDQLAELGDLIHQRAPTTVTYGHDEIDGRRVLTYLAGSGHIAPPALTDPPDVALLAPIANELPASVVVALRESVRPRLTVLLIQGWLRRLAIGEPARPLALPEVPDSTWDAFGEADAIVVSTEDLAESPEDPFVEASGLRERLGPRPLLLLTLGAQGYLLDDPGADHVVAVKPRRVVEGVPMVGAGDTFGASLAIHLGRGATAAVAARAATDAVIRMLEGRRSGARR